MSGTSRCLAAACWVSREANRARPEETSNPSRAERVKSPSCWFPVYQKESPGITAGEERLRVAGCLLRGPGAPPAGDLPWLRSSSVSGRQAAVTKPRRGNRLHSNGSSARVASVALVESHGECRVQLDSGISDPPAVSHTSHSLARETRRLTDRPRLADLLRRRRAASPPRARRDQLLPQGGALSRCRSALTFHIRRRGEFRSHKSVSATLECEIYPERCCQTPARALLLEWNWGLLWNWSPSICREARQFPERLPRFVSGGIRQESAASRTLRRTIIRASGATFAEFVFRASARRARATGSLAWPPSGQSAGGASP